MSELFEIPQNFKDTAWADDEKYQQMYRQSLENPEAFWAKQAERVDWFKKWDKVLDWNYPVSYTHLTLPTNSRV